MAKENYTILFRKSARKEFQKLPKKIQSKVTEALMFLSLNPYTELLQIKKLKGPEDLYRIRIGNYRVIYTIENKKLTVIVVKIGHRKEVY